MKTKKLSDRNEGCDENYDRDDEIKLNFTEDYRYLSRSPIGILMRSKYCKCGQIGGSGRVRYDERLSTNKCKTGSNDLYVLDKGAFYLTKKSLMLNQFLEYKNVNDVAVNRFGKGGDEGEYHLGKADFDPESKTSVAQTLCLPSSVFCDKRLVSLFRSVALYWFFCLNTVLAKGDLFKRKTLTAFEVPKSNTLNAFDSNLRLQICQDVLENFDDMSNDFLCKVMLKEAETRLDVEAANRSSLLVYAEHSKEKLFDDLFRKVLLNLADTNGVFVANNTCTRNRSMSRKIQAEESTGRASSSPKKTGAGSPKHGSRKYAFDVFDYGYIGGTFYNRIVWKKRAIKNKSKSKRKCDVYCRSERIQEIIIECVEDQRFTDDGFEEVMTVMEEPAPAPAPAPATSGESVGSGDSGYQDVFVDFDCYVQDLKRRDREQEDNDNESENENANTNVEPTPSLASSDSNMETQTLADEVSDSYFLPDGMLNVEERDYPEYDLWCSPLIAEEVLPPKATRSVPKVKIAEPSPEAFKPYSLWESSFAAEEDYIPNFETPEVFSVFSMPYYPPNKRHPVHQEPSVYDLWGSPNIIDFLPGIGCVHEYLSSRSSSSSDSLDSVYSNDEKFQVLTTRRGQENASHFVRGKFLNFKPVVNGFVSFTDRGAFKYYKRPEQPRNEFKKRNPDATKITLLGVMDATDVEVKNIVVATPPQNDYDTPFYFKPIQPAVKVETDLPANFERSESGTLYCNSRKLMTFKHELDSQRNPADLFQPKFIVSANDVACQTDRFGCPSVVNFNAAAVRENQPSHYGSGGPKKTQEPHVSGATFFYSLEEVFNFLGKPGLGNIDVKAHVDFSCMF